MADEAESEVVAAVQVDLDPEDQRRASRDPWNGQKDPGHEPIESAANSGKNSQASELDGIRLQNKNL